MLLWDSFCLQLVLQLMQPLWEQLVWLDRVHWAREQGLWAELKAALPGASSPRDLSLWLARPGGGPSTCTRPTPRPGNSWCAPYTSPAACPAAAGWDGLLPEDDVHELPPA